MANKPIREFGETVKIAVWQGKRGTAYSFSKEYETTDGKNGYTNYLELDDLKVLVELLPKVINTEMTEKPIAETSVPKLRSKDEKIKQIAEILKDLL